MFGTKRFLVFFVSLFFLSAKNVLATCTVSVTPNNVVMGVSSVSRFSVSNTGDQPGNWVRIESPDLTAYSIAQSDSEGWYGSGGGTRAEFAGGYLESGSTGVFDLTLAETGGVISSMNWEALVSYDAGENFESCGTATIQVVPAPVAPQISGINLTVGNSSATLTWTTNLTATGAVSYGITSGYGGSVVTASGTTHTAGITGLSASTEYHYQIQSTSQGGTATTVDATFTTSAADVVTTVTTTVTNTYTITTTNTNTVSKIVTDTTSPTVTIDKLEKRINETVPVLTGGAVDDRGVASVEYQVVGKDTAWITASLNEKVGTKKVTWEALPSLSLDGTYKIKFRAVDVFGNTGVAKEVEFVIDQLPPTVGGGVLSVGALTISENGFGVIEAIENVEYELVLFENGGADKLTLDVGEQKIEMKKIGSGLWRGLMKFNTGEWVIKVSATDGAENTTARDWAKVVVLKSGNVTKNGHIIKDGRVRVMWLDPTFKKYSQWEADDYGQVAQKELKNPGALSWILPRGEYYLEALVDGKPVVSQKIILDTTTNISGDWEIQKVNENFLEKLLSSIGWKSLVRFTGVKDNLSLSTQAFRKLEVARELWIGKRSLVLVTSPDLPRAGEALRQAKEVANENESQLVVVGLLKSENDLKTWLGSQTSGLYADYKGEWLEKMKVGILPQLYEIDSRGEIVREKVGVIK